MLFSLRRQRNLPVSRGTHLRREPKPTPDARLQETPDTKPSSVLFSMWNGLFRATQRLEIFGWLISVAIAAVIGASVVALVALIASDNRLLIDKIEVPEALSKAGINSGRLEVALQEALHALVDSNAQYTRLPGQGPNDSRLAAINAPQAVRSDEGLKVNWSGNVFSLDYLAYSAKSFFGIGAPQSRLTLRIATVNDSSLNLHVSINRPGEPVVYWSQQIDNAEQLLSAHGESMKKLANQLHLAYDPSAALQRLIADDMKAEGWIGEETMEVVLAAYGRLSPYERFWLATEHFTHTQKSLKEHRVMAGTLGDRARIYERTMSLLPEAPWMPHSLDAQVKPGACKDVDRQLFALTANNLDRVDYESSALLLMAHCMSLHKDFDTFRRIERDGLFKRWNKREQDAFELALRLRKKDLTKSNNQEHVTEEEAQAIAQQQNYLDARIFAWNSSPAQVAAYRKAKEIIEEKDPHHALRLLTDAFVFIENESCLSKILGTSAMADEAKEACISMAEALEIVSSSGKFSNSGDTPPELAAAVLNVCRRVLAISPHDMEGLDCVQQQTLLPENGNDAAASLAWLEKAIAQIHHRPGIVTAEKKKAMYERAAWLRHQLGYENKLVESLLSAVDDAPIVEGIPPVRPEWYQRSRCPTDPKEGRDEMWSIRPWEVEPFNKIAGSVVARQARLQLQYGSSKVTRLAAVHLLKSSRNDNSTKGTSNASYDNVNENAFDGHLLMGAALLVEGYFEAAERSLNKALELRPFAEEPKALAAFAAKKQSIKAHKNLCSQLSERYPYERFRVPPFESEALDLLTGALIRDGLELKIPAKPAVMR